MPSFEKGADPSVAKARAQALRLLKFRARSETELKERLAGKGCSPVVIETILNEYKKKNFVNDEKYARYFAAQQMASKPQGKRAILQKLKSKGIVGPAACEAVDKATEEKSELEVAREIAQERFLHFRGLDLPAQQRRLFGFLSRRGFPSDVVYRVVKEVTKNNDEVI